MLAASGRPPHLRLEGGRLLVSWLLVIDVVVVGAAAATLLLRMLLLLLLMLLLLPTLVSACVPCAGALVSAPDSFVFLYAVLDTGGTHCRAVVPIHYADTTRLNN